MMPLDDDRAVAETLELYLVDLDNTGRWGVDDVAGTLNHLTDDLRSGAARLIRSGRQVGCARPVGLARDAGPGRGVLHWMTKSGPDNPARGPGTATDWVGLALHGTEYTHVDAHAHCFWNGTMYNGRPMDRVTTERGALDGGVEPLAAGVSGRGVLFDGVLANDGRPLAAGVALRPQELEDFLTEVGVSLAPGDLLHVRTGNTATHERDGLPGLHHSCLPWLQERRVSVLLTDAVADVFPPPYAPMPEPVHTVGIARMGLWIVDNADFAELAEVCRETGSYAFFAGMAPIPFRRATGSLVNPVAIF